MLGQDLSDELVIAGRTGMLDRFHHHPLGPEPYGRPPMELYRRTWLHRRELEPGELREQRVHAPPAPMLETNHEQIGVLKLGENRSRV